RRHGQLRSARATRYGNRLSSGGNTQPQAGLSTTSQVSTASTSSVSGLGDIILRLGVIAFFEDGNVPQLRPSLFLKCPTAKSSNGLGTGEYDAGIGIDASKWFGKMNLSGEGFYTWQGRAAGFGLKDYLSWTAGVGYELMEGVRPMLIIKGATAPSTYSGNLLEARARILWSLNPRTGLDLYASLGLAESSPDYGGGLAVSYTY
ncbi:MAG: transporter, partial [Desulfuromonadales bacterium]|nr:transporter [Desulfuromonadales bacterium]